MKGYSCACIMVQADSSKKNKMLMEITTKDAAKKYLTLHNLMGQIFWQKGVFIELMGKQTKKSASRIMVAQKL